MRLKTERQVRQENSLDAEWRVLRGAHPVGLASCQQSRMWFFSGQRKAFSECMLWLSFTIFGFSLSSIPLLP